LHIIPAMVIHYGKRYYTWQKRLGEFGGTIDLWKFEKSISESDVVLDFGCGGGYILENLKCKGKYGIEINPNAIAEAKSKKIIIYKKIGQIPSNLRFDKIISHHALEHTNDPFGVLKDLRKYLKENGTMIMVVPIDDWRIQKQYDKKDINQHLFAWTPLVLCNLFSTAGYKIKEVKIITHAWIPFSDFFYPLLPKFIYFLLCKIWSALTLNRQIRIIVSK
jgi:SAM-dependent methyltransferase